MDEDKYTWLSLILSNNVNLCCCNQFHAAKHSQPQTNTSTHSLTHYNWELRDSVLTPLNFVRFELAVWRSRLSSLPTLLAIAFSGKKNPAMACSTSFSLVHSFLLKFSSWTATGLATLFILPYMVLHFTRLLIGCLWYLNQNFGLR